MLNELRTSRSVLAWLCLAGLLTAACGGSSSETPPPLSPEPLNDPYRSNADFERRAGSAKAEASAEAGVPVAAPSPAAQPEKTAE